MTVYFSYVGDLDDPDFFWDKPSDAPGASNLPRRVIPGDTPDTLGVNVFFVMRSIESGHYEGKKLDWDAWGLKMTGGEIRALLSDPGSETERMLSALDYEKLYVLVVAEDA